MNKVMKIFASALLLVLAFSIKPSEAVIRLGVPKFQSESGTFQSGQLDIITDNFINTLAGSKSIAIIERSRFDMIAREQKLNLSGLVDTAYAVKIGKLAGCQYMIAGSVYQKEAVNIVVRVVDVNTGEINFSMSENSSSSNISSLISAASLLGNRVREEIAGEYAYVSEVKGRSIHISRGSKDGVHRGDLYRVYADGAEVLDAEGKSLGHDVIDIAIVRIKDARPNFSIAEIVKNGGQAEYVKRGSKVENISEEYAQELIDSGVFAAKRHSENLRRNNDRKTASKPEEKPNPVVKEPEKHNQKETVKFEQKTAQPASSVENKIARIRYIVPPLAKPQNLRIELTDIAGKRTVLNRKVSSGQKIDTTESYKQECVITIYLDNQSVWMERYR